MKEDESKLLQRDHLQLSGQNQFQSNQLQADIEKYEEEKEQIVNDPFTKKSNDMNQAFQANNSN